MSLEDTAILSIQVWSVTCQSSFILGFVPYCAPARRESNTVICSTVQSILFILRLARAAT
jgi:hypothetical protein